MNKQLFLYIFTFVVVFFTALTIYNPMLFNSKKSFLKQYYSVWNRTQFFQKPTVNASTESVFNGTDEPPKLYLTTHFTGRIGNQLFIYATLIGLSRAQGRVPFIADGGDLSNIFQITHVRKDISTNGWSGMGESQYATFDPKFMRLPQTNLSISGYLQCWRYFIHSQDEIRRELTLKPALQKEVDVALAGYRKSLNNHVLVGVHIRRGDFLASRNVQLGYGVANASYFMKAFQKIRSLLPNQNITFLVASEDLDWCKQNLNDSSVKLLSPGSAISHFAILSSCDHVILAGGTFGWWIGWLANGITIYYQKFILQNAPIHNGFNEADYYPPGWIGLDN